MDIKDETELKAVVVVNQRAYEVPREVAEYIKSLQPTEMSLCEITRVVLHKDQPYIFRHHKDCGYCAIYAKE